VTGAEAATPNRTPPSTAPVSEPLATYSGNVAVALVLIYAASQSIIGLAIFAAIDALLRALGIVQ